MELIVTVPGEAKMALERRAQARGCYDVTAYIERLITADLLAADSFDSILTPLRETFQANGISEEDADALFLEVREEISREREALGDE